MDWLGKNIWIIGASFGIGRSMALLYGQKGARLALSARTEEALSEVAEQLEGKGHLITACDVTNKESMNHAMQRVLNHFKKIDVIIFAAGIYQTGSLANFSLETAEKTLDTNYRGLLYVYDAILPYLKKEKNILLVIIGSVAGYYGFPQSTTYAATKAAVNSLTQSLKIDLEPYAIDVRLVCPGFVKTRLTDQNDFHMPFRISAEAAADIIIKGLASKKFEIHFPQQFTLFLKFMKFLPYSLFFKAMRTIDQSSHEHEQ